MREAVQNSLDARLSDDDQVEVKFRIIDLTDDALDRFLDAIDWRGLEDNLSAVPENRGGRAIATTTERISEEGLRLLVIEDRGTRGLEGTERRRSDTERNPFCALVRDELYSDKPEESAGGSFGLGKSVFWAYSGLKTVLFSSQPADPPAGKSGLRFIGRAALPWHKTGQDGECSGDGWLGQPVDRDRNTRRADSIWGTEARRSAKPCCCLREANESGLSIVVVGFSEPGEEDRTPEELVEAISAASIESFWPALVKGDLSITVSAEENDETVITHHVEPEEVDGYRELGDLLNAFSAGTLDSRPRLEPGQASMAWIDLDVPERVVRPTHPACKARAAVLVRLLEEGAEETEVVDRIFRFRGPGMIIRSESRGNLSLAARPYIAAVLAGIAAGDTDVQHRAEAFLRAAEPPAHDKWTANTRKLKQEYVVHGCKSRLDRFDADIRAVITKLVSKPQETGGQLPKALLHYLRFAGAGGGGNPRFVSVTQPKAQATDDGWRFSVTCRRVREDDQPWHVRIKLKYARDGGGGDDIHAIGSVESDGAVRTVIANGVAQLEFPSNLNRVSIRGRTDPDLLPAIGVRAALALWVDGERGGLPDA